MQAAKYALAAWKLQNKHKGLRSSDQLAAAFAIVNSKLAAAMIAKEAGLGEFAVEAWAKFLSGDNVQKKPYLAAWKDAVAAQDAKTDLSADAAALAAIQAIADQLQKDVAAALDKRRAKEPLDKTAKIRHVS